MFLFVRARILDKEKTRAPFGNQIMYFRNFFSRIKDIRQNSGTVKSLSEARDKTPKKIISLFHDQLIINHLSQSN